MTLFIALAGAMVLLALLVVVLPLLRSAPQGADSSATLAVLADDMRALQRQRDQDLISAAEFEQERTELERQALQAEQASQRQHRAGLRSNRGTAVLLVIALPVLAIATYRVVGTPAGLDPALAQVADGNPHASSERAVAALEQRLAANPNDLQGWVLLGRSYSQLGRLEDATNAYKKAVVLDGDNPDLLIEYANTLAITRGRDLSGQPEQLIQHALDLDPDHLGALTFAGLAAFQRNDRDQALRYWHHLVSLLPADSEGRQRIEELIARTEGDAPAPQEQPQAAGAAITGAVVLAPALADQVQEGDTLYVFARAPDGPPMPLAAMRSRVGNWPVHFQLDDSSAMVEDLRLSQFERVDVVARISRQGSATAQAGDLEGAAEQVVVGSQDVDITIDRVIQD